ncbi:hypothetical protein Slin14017_G015050 [Septoria linicola]|nr:hypothetical protein Slin14017_G015050 [Septoria linicola]
MARADSSSKALIKAAIRSERAELTRDGSGSNGKWLVLCDELYEEVCTEFTVRKLDIGPLEKRALFDAEWVSQVTYELITKPARPKRRNAQRANTERATDSVEPVSSSQRMCSPMIADLATVRVSTPTPSSTFTSSTYPTEQGLGFRTVNYNPPPRSSPEGQDKHVSQAVTSIGRESDQPAWYRTVMN